MSDEVVTASDARVAAFLAAAQDAPEVDPRQAQLDIVRRILSADTIEDILQQQQGIHARDVLGEQLTITGIRFMESSLEGDGLGFYQLVDCVAPDGEPYVITCGAVNVMAQLFALDQKGAFPLLAQLVEVGKPTKAGFKPMWLEGVRGGDSAKSYDPRAKARDF